MKRVQYIGSTSLTADTVIGKTWAPGEALLVDSDAVANAIVASSTNFRDTTATSMVLGIAAGASRTLTAADNGKIVPVTAANLTLTLPSDNSVDSVDIALNVASANLTITAPASVTINGTTAGSVVPASQAQYSTLRLRRVAANVYVIG